MPPKRRNPGDQCLCRKPCPHHIGQCTNKVWGHGRSGHLYKLCDACRIGQIDQEQVNTEQPRTEQPSSVTPGEQPDNEPAPAAELGRALPESGLLRARETPFSDPLWTEPF